MCVDVYDGGGAEGGGRRRKGKGPDAVTLRRVIIVPCSEVSSTTAVNMLLWRVLDHHVTPVCLRSKVEDRRESGKDVKRVNQTDDRKEERKDVS